MIHFFTNVCIDRKSKTFKFVLNVVYVASDFALTHSFDIFTVVILFHATGLFLYPLKASANQRISNVVRGCKKRPVV